LDNIADAPAAGAKPVEAGELLKFAFDLEEDCLAEAVAGAAAAIVAGAAGGEDGAGAAGGEDGAGAAEKGGVSADEVEGRFGHGMYGELEVCARTY
jgi:hypothetical protein